MTNMQKAMAETLAEMRKRTKDWPKYGLPQHHGHFTFGSMNKELQHEHDIALDRAYFNTN